MATVVAGEREDEHGAGVLTDMPLDHCTVRASEPRVGVARP